MTASDPTFRCRHLLVTGGAGFIGGNLVRRLLAAEPDLLITNLDALTYSASRASLADVECRHGDGGDRRHRFVHGDIRDRDLVGRLLDGGNQGPPVDAVAHLAAESHVDRSILGPIAFVETNVTGTACLLEAVRASLAARARPFRFLHVSTDEVYGSLGPDDPAFDEETPIAPRSPYAASKASSDLLVLAHVETFGLPAVITRCSNNYGPYQFPEKLIPLAITHALADRPIPVYGDGRNVRDWIHVDDHCDGLWTVLRHGVVGRCYNLGGEAEVENLTIVQTLLRLLGKPLDRLRFVTDRPGHDRRYAMDIRRARAELGWAPGASLDQGLAETVRWYLDNPGWWQPLLPEAGRVAATLYRS
ncbi:MAG: dTDP-glucose 4,6-dehydratase [Ectothiorhodospiraceae bacterium]|nr:dTDP-glucose 4,6-dehydratase [Ectothiorhodospiraceae bacterium]